MPRAESTDFLHNFRFHVRAIGVDGVNRVGESGLERPEAGFQSVTLPEMSTEPVEYRDGLSTFTKKFPGIPTVTNCTMMRGVTKRSRAFYQWVQDCAKGGEYRADLEVLHWHRDAKTPDQIEDATKARIYRLFNCFASRVKVAADLAADAGDVSMEELDVEVEFFEVVDGRD